MINAVISSKVQTGTSLIQNNRRFFRSILVLLILFFSEGILFADSYVGKITRVQGKVTVSRPGVEQTRLVKAGDTVSTGDLLQTGKDSMVQLVFTDDSFVNVLPESALRVNQYSYTPEDSRRTAVIKVLAGRTRFVIYKKRSSGSFTVETGHASISADISDFMVNDVSEETEVADIGDPIIVKNISLLTLDKVRLGTNQKTVVRGKNPPCQPSVLTSEQRRKYIRDASF